MATRKNANALTATEKEELVRAFVMMKADPVPGRPYNWFDAFALIHRYIQNVNAPAVAGGSPATNNVNFGHNGAAFTPWPPRPRYSRNHRREPHASPAFFSSLLGLSPPGEIVGGSGGEGQSRENTKRGTRLPPTSKAGRVPQCVTLGKAIA